MPGLLDLSPEVLRYLLMFNHTQACSHLLDADAVAYGLRISEHIPRYVLAEGLFAKMIEGLSSSIQPEEFLNFLDLLPIGSLPAIVKAKLWQFGHFLLRADRRFQHHRLNPVGYDLLAEQTATVLLRLLYWFKGYSFRARHRCIHLLSATCPEMRLLLQKKLVRPARCQVCKSLNEFHHATPTDHNGQYIGHDPDYRQWLNKNAVFGNWFQEGGALLGHNMSFYLEITDLMRDLINWSPRIQGPQHDLIMFMHDAGNTEMADSPGTVPPWLLPTFKEADVSLYSEDYLFGVDREIRISWHWNDADLEQEELPNIYNSTLLPMRQTCDIPEKYQAGAVDTWLWPVTPHELVAWQEHAVYYMAKRRECVRKSYASISARVKILKLDVSGFASAVTHHELCMYEHMDGIISPVEGPLCTCGQCPFPRPLDPPYW